jgi:hypothetical protein
MHYTAQISKPAHKSKVTILKTFMFTEGVVFDKLDGRNLGFHLGCSTM